MGMHLLRYVHGNKHIGTHDAICDTFVAIMWDAGFHVGMWDKNNYMHSFNHI